MTMIYADDLQPGDVVDYHGELHRITHIERCDGWAWPVAYDDAGWAMALGHDPVDVRRATARRRRRSGRLHSDNRARLRSAALRPRRVRSR